MLTPHTIAENSPIASTVGTLTSVDADVGDTFIYALVPGAGSTDNGSFRLTGDVVSTAGVFDFETKSVNTIRVRSTDSGGQVFEKPLTINVLDIDEAPVAVVGTAPLVVKIGDVNGDGRRDLVVANSTASSVSVLLGTGGAAFAPATTFATGAGPVALVLADWNHDGNLDIATANTTDTTMTILTGNGSGAFGGAVTLITGPQPTGLATGDLNNDAKADLLLASNGTNSVSVFLGN